MKKIFALTFLLTTLNVQAEITTKEQAEITTKEQADKFLHDYCIALVNEIEKAVEKQKVLAKKENWDEFMKTGAWISGISDIYSKLCK